MENCKRNLKSIMETQDFVCISSDNISSKNNKSFFGVTTHIIDTESLKRNLFVLACRRIKYSHTHDPIGNILHNIHQEFISDISKISGTVTDNANNFCKAFKIFRYENTNENGSSSSQIEVNRKRNRKR